MRPFSGLTVAVVLALLLAHQASAFPRTKRQAQLQEDDSLAPDNEALNPNEEANRGKRFFEPVQEVGWKAKNAILGLVFGKINSLIDSKTRLIDQLDKQNIAKNKQYGIEPPGTGSGLSDIIGSITNGIQSKVQFLGPKINLFTGLIGSLSGGSSGGSSSGDNSSGGGGGSGIGSLLRIFTSLSGSSSGGGGGTSGSGTLTISDSNDDDDDDDDEGDDA